MTLVVIGILPLLTLPLALVLRPSFAGAPA
jgi:hypothetical protein